GMLSSSVIILNDDPRTHVTKVDHAIGVTQVEKGLNRFKSNRTSVESDQGSGRPQTARNASDAEKEENLIRKDRRMIVQEIAEQVENIMVLHI
ncbi:hypothetical protein TNCV_239231, partial [Trichonephila clavipes]